MSNARVVVLGGGYAGQDLAAKLDKHCQVTLVDRRDAQVFKIASLRAGVNSKWAEKGACVISREKLLKKGKIVVGDVAQVDAAQKRVTLADGKSLEFDYLAIATGSTTVSPGEPLYSVTKTEQLKAHFVDVSRAVSQASKIVIIGGGVVGVELAGEIAHYFPSKQVTILHSHDKFLSDNKPPLPESFQKEVTKQLDKAKVKYILNDKAIINREDFRDKAYLEGQRVLRTASGKSVEADLVFLCTGSTVNSKFCPPEWLAASGRIKVLPTLQVQSNPNIFALGDVADTDENKQAYLAGLHAAVVAANIKSLAKGGQATKKYSPNKSALILASFGPKGGIMATPLGTFGAFLSSNLKSKKLFLPTPLSNN